MAKKKVGSCDGECEAYKKLRVEVHEPEIEEESWDVEDDADWQDELITELIEENEILEIKLEKKERMLETSKWMIWAVVVWNLILTAVCAIF